MYNVNITWTKTLYSTKEVIWNSDTVMFVYVFALMFIFCAYWYMFLLNVYFFVHIHISNTRLLSRPIITRHLRNVARSHAAIYINSIGSFQSITSLSNVLVHLSKLVLVEFQSDLHGLCRFNLKIAFSIWYTFTFTEKSLLWRHFIVIQETPNIAIIRKHSPFRIIYTYIFRKISTPLYWLISYAHTLWSI